MAVREVRASGLEYLALATKLLQRARLLDAEAGVWEAGDLQWWWRTPRRSDAIDQLFWIDDDGPVAAVVLADWDRVCECVPILVSGSSTVSLATVWASAVEAIDVLKLDTVEVLARDDDQELLRLLSAAGFVADRRSWFTWMAAQDRPERAALPEGFVLVDRARETSKPHPMRRRNGEAVEERLRQCSLYDPALDLAVETADGRGAGYALFWFDPVTEVGLVEPMRVEDEFQRRGLARALLTEGLDRLAARGARRLKVGFGTEAARALYLGAGFGITCAGRSYRWERLGKRAPGAANPSESRSSSVAPLRSNPI
jgi:GNAT superfamily N-acetyltransferase